MATPKVAVVQTSSVSRSAVNALLEAAGDAAAAAGFEAAIAVVDAGGNLKGFSRTDDAGFLTGEVAIGKAWTAASLGSPTHLWNERLANPKEAPLAHHPRILAIGGGYPLLYGGQVVGGIGVSGGHHTQDQGAALAALKVVGFETT